MNRKMIGLKVLVYLPLVLVFILASCNNDEFLDGQPVELFNDGDHILSYSCQGDNIEFFMDVLGDTSNAVMGDWPNKDIYRIYVDVNRNNVIDEGIDLMFSPVADNSVCTVRLISSTASSGCSFDDGVEGRNLFSTSDNSGESHVNFRVTVPKEILSNDASAHVIIHLLDSNTGWQFYPSNGELFDDHFEINW